MAITFTELGLQAATLVGKTDTATLALAQQWAFYWHTFIWDQYLLRENQAFVYTTVSAGATEVIAPPQFERILQVRTDAGTLLEYQEPGSMLRLRPQAFEETGPPTAWTDLPPMGIKVRPGNEKISFTAGASDVGKTIVLKGESAGEEIRETITLVSGTVNSVNNYDLIFPLGKPLTVGDVTVQTVTSAQAGATLHSFERTKRYCRIELFPSPTAVSTVILLQGKRGAPILTDGGDTVSLRTAERPLMDLVISSIWENARQSGMATAKKQEALAELAAVAERENNQSANNLRINPDDYGTNAYDGGIYWKY